MVTIRFLALRQEVTLRRLIQNIATHEGLLFIRTAADCSPCTKLPLRHFLLWHAHVDIVGDINGGLCLLLTLAVVFARIT